MDDFEGDTSSRAVSGLSSDHYKPRLDPLLENSSLETLRPCGLPRSGSSAVVPLRRLPLAACLQASTCLRVTPAAFRHILQFLPAKMLSRSSLPAACRELTPLCPSPRQAIQHCVRCCSRNWHQHPLPAARSMMFSAEHSGISRMYPLPPPIAPTTMVFSTAQHSGISRMNHND
ncbi:hypothetical protein Y1Q_0005930 [Alligator mississippiensis]|uniref:Uncharacterized protein n=1 Tax=Alligator mississippiensis TaxID=8496 RepID=A0A151P6D1_ALLMI|nr:hypothetical protein Y1Q_0005930 [Alligator mississippiensis]